MISIRNSVTELEKCHQEREIAVDSYLAALRNISAYAVELGDELSGNYRRYVEALAGEVAAGGPETLLESRSTLRALLRDYRDKAAKYVSDLREELAGTARALEEILESLSQADGDHEANVRRSLASLRQIANSKAGSQVRVVLENVVGDMEHSVEQMRKQHQLTVSQIQVEIRMLHNRIDALQAAASLDEMTQLYNRTQTEERVRSAASEACLLLVRASGIRLAEVQYRDEVAAELAAAFVKRLRNSLPPLAVMGRWSREEFIAILDMPKHEVTIKSKWISEQLSGSYSCLRAGKTVHPSLHIDVAVIEVTGNTPDRLIQRVTAFLSGE
jgi:GGDEF domain-containing protein